MNPFTLLTHGKRHGEIDKTVYDGIGKGGLVISRWSDCRFNRYHLRTERLSHNFAPALTVSRVP